MTKLFLTILLVIFFSANAFCGLTLSLYGGERYYLSSEHKPYNEQFTRGVRLDFGKDTWPVNLAADFYLTNHSDLHYINSELTELDTTLTEIRLGLRKYFGKGMRFMLAGGIENMEYIRKEKTLSGSSRCFDSTKFNLFKNGVWVETGADYTLGKLAVIGVKVDYSNGYVHCGGSTIDLNAVNGGIYLGITW
jgi:hypothetical protein